MTAITYMYHYIDDWDLFDIVCLCGIIWDNWLQYHYLYIKTKTPGTKSFKQVFAGVNLHHNVYLSIIVINVWSGDHLAAILVTIMDFKASRVARAFSGGRLAHPEGQNKEENKWSLRKDKKNWSKFEEKMRKVEPLPNRDCEAGYGSVIGLKSVNESTQGCKCNIISLHYPKICTWTSTMSLK